MKTTLLNAYWLLAIILLPGFSAPSDTNLKKAEWLLGTWENHTSRGIVYEHWEKLNQREFSGKSYMVHEQDTMVLEVIRLVEEDSGLVYIPVVGFQNAGLPVRFRSKLISESELVFENAEHDFPQVISYLQMGPDSLVAEISGMKNGSEDRQVFPMKRVN